MSITVSQQLVHLAELARLDQRAKVVADRLEHLPLPAKKADVATARLQSDLDAAHSKKNAALLAKKQGETEITEERHKIRKWESRANELKGEREHAALGSEIGTAKRQIKHIEDAVLEHMETLEQVDKDIAALLKKHAAAVVDARAEWLKVEGDLKALRIEYDGFGVGKKALLDQLPAPVIRRYEIIATKRQGVGVAIITPQDNCDACHRAVPPQLVIQIMKGQVVESCPACNRLLVHHAMTRVEVAS